MSEQNQRLRAYRFTLDPTAPQAASLAQHAGAARWAYNHGLALKEEANRRRQLQIDELVTMGYTQKQARQQTVTIPRKGDIQKRWNQLKGDNTRGLDGICPWWRMVSTYAFQSAWDDLDQAWKNWVDTLTGNRQSNPAGRPRYKRKGRSRDSFRLHHSTKHPGIRPDGYRRLRLPKLGSIRIHDSTKRLYRALDRGGVVQSVTISRGGHRWYASVLVSEPAETPAPTRRQRQAGTVGVNLGSRNLAALSTGETVANPRHLQAAQKRLGKAQQAFARTQRGSRRRQKAAARLGKIHHQVAAARSGTLHQVTTWLATRWETVALQDLSVVAMTRSARGTREKPGRNVRAKAAINRAILDAAPGEFRRQLEYKTSWYGSQLALCDRWYPTSQTCSTCGAAKTKPPLHVHVFRCPSCGLVLDRGINAARNIAAVAVAAVACDRRETENARGDRASPPSSSGSEATATVAEAGRPGKAVRPPRGSDPPTTLSTS